MASIACNPYGAAAILLAQFQIELASTRAGAPALMAVHQGQNVVAEGCDSAWVAFGPARPHDGRRGPAHLTPSSSVVVWVFTLQLGAYRCYPTTATGAMPPLPAIDSAARDIADDAEAMRRAAVAAFAEHREIDVVAAAWTPIPPQGAVHGSTMEVQVSISMGAMADDVLPKLPGDPRA